MRAGFSLMELVLVLAVVALVSAVGLPRLSAMLDHAATDAAARDVTTLLAVARAAAVSQGQRARLSIAPDTLRLDLLDPAGWRPFLRWPGPLDRGVALQVSNPEVQFGPTGVGWGPSNTTVTLRRGSHIETITTSRVGRVKRW